MVVLVYISLMMYPKRIWHKALGHKRLCYKRATDETFLRLLYVYGTIIGIPQPPPRDVVLSALFSNLCTSDLHRFLKEALRAPSLGEGCVIPITVPYTQIMPDKAWNFASGHSLLGTTTP